MVLSSGARLGPYRIQSEIGKGGMGEVYLSKDTRLDRNVAIKVLPEHLANDAGALKRFQREAKALAALSHPNILTIYDVGTDQGVSFVVMELLEGETLRSRITHSPLAWKKAVEIAVEVTEGLSAAHSKGIIHRDLKPENIFLTRDSRIKILDFGLVRWKPAALQQASTAAPTVSAGETKPGILLGTIAYMSPEQVRGSSVDIRSDLFSFGCILYEMITGKRPFSHETFADIMAAILKEIPPGVAEVSREVPNELDHIVMRCLEKDPIQRFQTSNDLGFALREILAKSSDSQKMQVTSSSIRSLAVLPLANLSGDPAQEYFADGMTDALITDLAKLRVLKVISRTSVMRYKSVEKVLPEIARELNVDAVIEGSVLRAGNRVRITAQLIEAATDQHLWAESYERELHDILKLQGDVAAAIAKEIQITLTPEQSKQFAEAPTVHPKAHEAYLKGLHYFGILSADALQKAMEYFEEAIQLNSNHAPAHAQMAYAYLALGIGHGAGSTPPHMVYQRAKAEAGKALEIDETLAEAHASMGIASLLFEWNWKLAKKELQCALELNPSYPRTHQYFAHYLMLAGKADEAIAEARRAQELDPLWPLSYVTVAAFCYIQRDYDQALEHLRKALELNPNFVPAIGVLAEVHLQKGLHSEAVSELQKMLVASGGNPRGKGLLGYAYALANEREEAQKLLIELRETSAQQYVDPLWVTLILAGLGEKAEALNSLQRAYDEGSPWLPHFMTVYPILDNLRSEPRFQKLLQQMNLPIVDPA